jgi:2,5-diamino-6-(ribosylamino)-4(3H)-pyrimidinone 5'-phosphate reductase
MRRPHLIVHTMASADGRVSLGPNRTAFDDVGDERWQATWGSIENLEDDRRALVALHKPQVLLEGSGSIVKEGSRLQELPGPDADDKGLYEDYLPSSVVDSPDHLGWLAMVDGRGRVRSGMKEFPGWEGWHTLHLVSNATPREYLAFLRRNDIPYLVAGRERVSLAQVMAKLSSLLGVSTVISTAGSRLNGALLRAGLVDEVSLVLAPALVGGTATPTLFESEDLGESEWPTRLELLSVDSDRGGRVTLRYRVLTEASEA